MKRYLPRSLFWRTVLIVVAPMLILQAVLAYLIVKRHFDGVTRQMTEGVASEVSYLVDLVDAADSDESAARALRLASETLNFPIRLSPQGRLGPPHADDRMFFDVVGRAVEEELRAQVSRPMAIAFMPEEKTVVLRVATRRGVVYAELPRRRLVASNPHLLLTWMAATAVLLIAISVVYLRNQVRPIVMLANAAEAFGKGRMQPLSVSGAEEVRRATTAFLAMRSRIERQIEQRTRMLSGVSHDMRTPLTRMRLALEMMDDLGDIQPQDLKDLRKDVGDLEHILEEFLAYARGDQGEEFVETDVADLARAVVAEARRLGASVALSAEPGDGETPATLSIRPNAIKRSLHNLVENAVSYGENALLTLEIGRRYIQFIVEDDGPGIPPEQRDDAFRAFSRLDEARNRNNTRGVGLGLALALDAVRGHGGDLTLDQSERMGGLKAVARLPR